MTPQRSDIVTYVYLAFSWGISFMVALKTIAAFGFVGATTLRCFMAGLALIAIARVSGIRLDFRGRSKPVTVLAISAVVGQLLGLSYAAPLIGSAMLAIFVTTIPFFSMLIGQFWGIETITRQRFAGLMLGAVGMVMLVGFPAHAIDQTFLTGCLVALFGAFSAAFGSVYASQRMDKGGTWELTSGSFLVGSVMIAPINLFIDGPGLPPLSGWGWLLISGIVMSGINYLLYFRLVSRIGPTPAVTVEFCVTVIAVFVGTLGLGEKLTLIQMVGAAIILIGCMIVLGIVGARRKPDRPV